MALFTKPPASPVWVMLYGFLAGSFVTDGAGDLVDHDWFGWVGLVGSAVFLAFMMRMLRELVGRRVGRGSAGWRRLRRRRLSCRCGYYAAVPHAAGACSCRRSTSS
ncbi:hypothetical protein KRM28CT15_00120 [Krasilnikovia sp. M28-CT-15]